MNEGELVSQTIECAMDVQSTLGSGFSEHAYHSAMVTCLSENAVSTTTEATIPVYYHDKPIARLHPDLIVGTGQDRVMVELKTGEPKDAYVEQLERYMQMSEDGEIGTIYRGLLVCFGERLAYEDIER